MNEATAKRREVDLEAAPLPPRKPRRAPYSRPQRTLRFAIFLAAFVSLALSAKVSGAGFIALGLSLLSGLALFLLLRLRALNHEALWLSASLVLGLSLYTKPFFATATPLLGYFLLARTPKPMAPRGWLRMQGAMQSLAAGVASLVAFKASLFLHPLPLSLQSLAVALLTAGAFLSAYSLLHTLVARFSSANSLEHRSLPHRRLLYGVGAVVILSPLQPALGSTLLLPLALPLTLLAVAFRAREEAKALKEDLRAARDMGKYLTQFEGVRDPVTISQQFLSLVHPLLPSESAQIWLLDTESRILTPRASLSQSAFRKEQRAVLGEGLIGKSAEETAPRLIPNVSRDPWSAEAERRTEAWLLYPIRAKGELLALGQWTRPANQPFTYADIARIEALLPSYTMALEGIAVRESMHLLASTDGLTGVWNHQRIKEILRDEMRRCMRYHRPLSVLMLDVDNFKSFNDTYGHPQGDQLLRNIASALSASIRNVDYVGRYGGEEFLIILPETTKDDAYRLAERVRYNVSQHAYVMIEDTAIVRTVSVGVASCPEDALSAQELVERADAALYHAKRTGKNRVIWA